jgi:peroxisomal enoyl-CoA hydratase 2
MTDEVVNTQELIGKTSSFEASYNRRDLVLYAVGIGCDELRFIYENDSDFAAFPTYPVCLPFKGLDQDIVSFPSPSMAESNVMPGLPGSKFVLDGERFLEIFQPLSVDGGKYTVNNKVRGF